MAGDPRPGQRRRHGPPPRPAGERILLSSAVKAAGTLGVLVLAPGPEPRLGEASVAGTMAVAGTMSFATFVLCQAFNLLHVRHFTTSGQWLACVGAASSIIVVGEMVKAITRARQRQRATV